MPVSPVTLIMAAIIAINQQDIEVAQIQLFATFSAQIKAVK